MRLTEKCIPVFASVKCRFEGFGALKSCSVDNQARSHTTTRGRVRRRRLLCLKGAFGLSLWSRMSKPVDTLYQVPRCPLNPEAVANAHEAERQHRSLQERCEFLCNLREIQVIPDMYFQNSGPEPLTCSTTHQKPSPKTIGNLEIDSIHRQSKS